MRIQKIFSFPLSDEQLLTDLSAFSKQSQIPESRIIRELLTRFFHQMDFKSQEGERDTTDGRGVLFASPIGALPTPKRSRDIEQDSAWLNSEERKRAITTARQPAPAKQALPKMNPPKVKGIDPPSPARDFETERDLQKMESYDFKQWYDSLTPTQRKKYDESRRSFPRIPKRPKKKARQRITPVRIVEISPHKKRSKKLSPAEIRKQELQREEILLTALNRGEL